MEATCKAETREIQSFAFYNLRLGASYNLKVAQLMQVRYSQAFYCTAVPEFQTLQSQQIGKETPKLVVCDIHHIQLKSFQALQATNSDSGLEVTGGKIKILK